MPHSDEHKKPTMIEAWGLLTLEDKQALSKLLSMQPGYPNMSVAALALVKIDVVVDYLHQLFHKREYWNVYGQDSLLMLDDMQLPIGANRCWEVCKVLADVGSLH